MVFSLKNEAQIASSISITFFAISFDTDTYDMNGSVQFYMTRGILQHNTLYIFTLKYVEVTHELFSFINKYQVDTLSIFVRVSIHGFHGIDTPITNSQTKIVNLVSMK